MPCPDWDLSARVPVPGFTVPGPIREEALMANARKESTVAGMREQVDGARNAVFTDYRGLTVAEITTLRRRLRDHGAEYHVVKNKLFRIALGDERGEALHTMLTGPTAVLYVQGDPVAPTKALFDYLRELRKPEIRVKGGWIEGKLYSLDQVTALSKLPPREQIIAQLVGALNAPIANLVGTLDGVIGEFVRTIQAIGDQKGGAPQAA